MLVHETYFLTEVPVRAYLNNGLLFFKIRSEKISFAFDMLSTLIFDELSVQTMLQTKQFANQRFTPTGLLILRGDLLSFFRMCEVETKLFHTC